MDDRFKKFGTVSFTAITKTNDFIDYLEKGKVAGTRCKDLRHGLLSAPLGLLSVSVQQHGMVRGERHRQTGYFQQAGICTDRLPGGCALLHRAAGLWRLQGFRPHRPGSAGRRNKSGHGDEDGRQHPAQRTVELCISES